MYEFVQLQLFGFHPDYKNSNIIVIPLSVNLVNVVPGTDYLIRRAKPSTDIL